ncbi:MAG TPA: signal peptidase I [Bacteroidales bacterium]
MGSLRVLGAFVINMLTMKRKLIISLIVVVSLAVLMLIANVSGILVLYHIKNNAIAPAFVKGNVTIASKLKKYADNSLICFTLPSPASQNVTYIRRIAGTEGDTIEINDGYLLRNGFMADNPEKVLFNYYVKREYVHDFKMFKTLRVQPKVQNDSIFLAVNYSEFNDFSNQLVLHKINRPKIRKEPGIFGSTNENHWNISNYGPIVVPKGYCFVLADNRDNYPDSRQWGFIPVKNIRGTVLTRR